MEKRQGKRESHSTHARPSVYRDGNGCYLSSLEPRALRRSLRREDEVRRVSIEKDEHVARVTGGKVGFSCIIRASQGGELDQRFCPLALEAKSVENHKR